MPRFGDFDTVREVSGGLWGAVYVARNPAGDERFAVKVFSPPAYQIEEAQLEADTVSFLEAVQTQSEISAVSEGVWSPIYQADRCEGGAWYVTDLFDRSAEKLVLYRRDLEGNELQHVVSSVLAGLAELRSRVGRPHGNLKPTNVLIAGRNDLSKARVALTDLVAGGKVRAAEDAIRDLHDVGDLIHQLVLHRQLKNVSAWPVESSEPWTRLGSNGKSWLGLCNVLLDPSGKLPTLDETISMLPGGLTRVLAEPPRSSRVGKVKGLLKDSSGGSSADSSPGSSPGLSSGSSVESSEGSATESSFGLGSRPASGIDSRFDSAAESKPLERGVDESQGELPAENFSAVVPEPAREAPEPLRAVQPRVESEFEVTVQEDDQRASPLPLNDAAAGAMAQRSGATSVTAISAATAKRPEAEQGSRSSGPDREFMDAAREVPASGSGRWIAASVAALLVVGAAALVVPKLMGPKAASTRQSDPKVNPKADSTAVDRQVETDKAEAVQQQAAKDQAAKVQAAKDQAAKDQAANVQSAKDQAAKDAAALALEKQNDAEAELQAKAKAKEEEEAERERLAKLARDEEAKLRETNAVAAASIAAEATAKELAIKEEEAKAAGVRNSAARAAVVSAAQELNATLARGFVAGEAVDGAATLEDRVAALQEMPGFAGARDGDAQVAGVVARVAGLTELGAVRDPRAASARASEELKASDRVAEARALWLNLVSPDQRTWPASAAAMGEARDLFTALRGAYGSILDKPRATALQAEAAAGIKRLWEQSLSLASTGNGFEADGPEIEKIVAMATSVGLEPDAVPGLVRFNFMLRDLKVKVASLGANPDDAAQRGLLKNFADGVERLPVETQRRPEVVESIKVARELLAPAAVSAGGGQNPADAGPKNAKGFAAGVVRNVDGVESVKFMSPGGQEIEFLRVGPGSFVSTQEVSVGLFIDTVEKAERWADVMESFRLQGDGATRGPRAWSFTTRSGRISVTTPAKAGGNRSNGWLQTSAQMQGTEVYPPGLNVEAPKLESPMQYVTPQAAAMVASLLGCRFPTSEEWQAALKLEQGFKKLSSNAAQANAPDNRRDSAWGRAVEQARANAARQPNSPDADFFNPGVLDPKGPAVPIEGSADGVVWFAPVDQGGGVRFHHLIGNVAEYLFDDPSAWGVAADPSPMDIGAKLKQGDKLKVVGGSALSPKEVVPETPYSYQAGVPANRPRPVDGNAPSDVGFRLAFSVVGSVSPSLPFKASDEVAKLSFIQSP